MPYTPFYVIFLTCNLVGFGSDSGWVLQKNQTRPKPASGLKKKKKTQTQPYSLSRPGKTRPIKVGTDRIPAGRVAIAIPSHNYNCSMCTIWKGLLLWIRLLGTVHIKSEQKDVLLMCTYQKITMQRIRYMYMHVIYESYIKLVYDS